MQHPQKQILIIDDDARNIFALTATLKARGYRCLAASDAAEGIGLLDRHEDIGIVLLDMMMPEIDGYEAIKLIRQVGPHTGQLPVVAVTAQAMKGDREKCLEAGANGYISKPIQVDNLLKLIEDALKKQ